MVAQAMLQSRALQSRCVPHLWPLDDLRGSIHRAWLWHLWCPALHCPVLVSTALLCSPMNMLLVHVSFEDLCAQISLPLCKSFAGSPDQRRNSSCLISFQIFLPWAQYVSTQNFLFYSFIYLLIYFGPHPATRRVYS